MYGSFPIFYGTPLDDYLRENDNEVISNIKGESEDYVLNINETEYLNHLFNKFKVDIPPIDFNGITVEPVEKEIPRQDFSFLPHTRRRESYPRPVYIYYLPFEGDGELFQYRPNPFLLNTIEVYIKDNCICFEIIDFNSKAEEITNEKNGAISLIKGHYHNFKNQLETYNNQLPAKIKSYFEARKQKILKNNELLASLDVPIRKKDDSKGTYAIPSPEMRKKINVKPKSSVIGYKPEPTLDEPIYHDILQTINNIGKIFERLPSTYKGKGEEELRDHILLLLEPIFEGYCYRRNI